MRRADGSRFSVGPAVHTPAVRLTAVLVLALTQAPAVALAADASGDPAASVAPASGPEAPPAVDGRVSPRLRLGVGVCVGASLLGGGVGVALDVGVVLGDRFAVLAHGSLDYFVLTNMALAAVMAEYGTDFVTLAAGAGVLGANIWNVGFTGVAVPFILGVTPFGRGAADPGRRGLHVAFEGGVAFATGPSRDRFTFFGGLRVGYALR